MPGTQVIILAKAPRPGTVKTRLIPVLGASGAAGLARCLLEQVIEEALLCGADRIELCGAPSPDDPAWRTVRVPEGILWTTQAGGDVGERMLCALTSGLAHGDKVILTGADCPGMDREVMRRSIASLNDHDATLIPALDGGYVLIGLKRIHPAIMREIPWSTKVVFPRTLGRLADLGYSIAVQPALRDIDHAEDLQYLPDRPPFSEFRTVAHAHLRTPEDKVSGGANPARS
ncbi:MAG TPA: TIGR04282 family arsenosugar biosynthesis glycosyltransferase [Gammaproteobacteria bacterium]|nr:TIGR04282 family arsenosugar biosynthesis glycosyltransferase [Gammaproteobacteria bacterium]